MPAGNGPTTPVVRRSSLREQVADALREEMMVGRLPAGAHFTVKEIADLYGVSATPAREALLDLTAQGLLLVEHHRGFAVPELSWQDYLDIVDARTLLADSLFRYLGRGRGIDWGRLPAVCRRAEAATRAVHGGQLDVLVGCDRRFWHEACELLGNPRISGYLDWLRVQSWMFTASRLRARPELVAECWGGHVELADRIAARDLPGARLAVLDYEQVSVGLMARLTGHRLDDAAAGLTLLDLGRREGEGRTSVRHAPAAEASAGPESVRPESAGPASDGPAAADLSAADLSGAAELGSAWMHGGGVQPLQAPLPYTVPAQHDPRHARPVG